MCLRGCFVAQWSLYVLLGEGSLCSLAYQTPTELTVKNKHTNLFNYIKSSIYQIFTSTLNNAIWGEHWPKMLPLPVESAS